MPLQKNQILTLRIERLSSDGSGVAHSADGEAVFVGFCGASEALFPWAALADEIVVVLLVVVEAEIAVAMTPERGGKRFGAFVSRALDARLRDPAHAN